MDLSGPIARAAREPSVEEARASLLAARTIAARSGRAAIGSATNLGMAVWGTTWLLGYLALQFLPLPLGWATWGPLCVVAYLITRQRRGATIRSGWEARIQRAWWATIAGTTVAMFLVAPTRPAVLILMPGVIWALAIVQYAIVAEDRALGGLGGAILAAALLARYLAPGWAALALALVGGGGMLALGVARSRRPWR